jgi:hypothetical protein
LITRKVPHQRESRVDHRRKLAGEDDDVTHLDAAAGPLLRRLSGVFDLDDVHPHAPELRDDVVAALRFDGRRRQLPAAVAGRIRK